MFREFCRIVAWLYFKLFHRTQFINIENVPKEGPIILYANHISNFDPPLVICPIKRMVYILAKQELFKNKLFGRIMRNWGAFPIKRGMKDISAIKNSLEKLKIGSILCMFPEGTRRKKGRTVKVKPGLAMLALKAKCLVLPAKVIGIPKPFRKLTVIYGKPIDLSKHYDKKLSTDEYIQLSENLMKEVEKLDGGK